MGIAVVEREVALLLPGGALRGSWNVLISAEFAQPDAPEEFTSWLPSVGMKSAAPHDVDVVGQRAVVPLRLRPVGVRVVTHRHDQRRVVPVLQVRDVGLAGRGLAPVTEDGEEEVVRVRGVPQGR